MTRGQDGSLLLSCMTLSFTTSHRFIPTLTRRNRLPHQSKWAGGKGGAGFQPARSLASAQVPTLDQIIDRAVAKLYLSNLIGIKDVGTMVEHASSRKLS